MFDFSKLAELFGGVAEQASQLAPDGWVQQLSDLGFDPTQLQELGVEDLMAQLGERGIDMGALDTTQISELVGQLGEGTPVAELIEQFTSGSGAT